MKVIDVNESNFEEEVIKSERRVLVDFNADWCGPCRMLRPILEDVASNTEDVKIASLNIDDEDLIAEEYNVSSIPCLILFEGGKEVNRSVGLIPKDAIIEFIGGK